VLGPPPKRGGGEFGEFAARRLKKASQREWEKGDAGGLVIFQVEGELYIKALKMDGEFLGAKGEREKPMRRRENKTGEKPHQKLKQGKCIKKKRRTPGKSS